MIHGRNLLIYVGNSVLAACKDCELQVTSDTIETSSPTQGAWHAGIGGRKSWSVRATSLVSAITSHAAMVGTTVTLRMQVAGVTQQRLSGTAIVKNWSVNASTGSLCKGTFTFEGTGALS